MLSPHGSLSVDERTNTLLVQDTPEKLADIRRLVQTLDVPVKQVLIEARIVVVTDNYDAIWAPSSALRAPSPSMALVCCPCRVPITPPAPSPPRRPPLLAAARVRCSRRRRLPAATRSICLRRVSTAASVSPC